jgi:uncharacterized protein YecE (DUF72 family)
MARAPVWIGTAGWSIPRACVGAFAGEGATLERYAGRFSAAEINSSFHRPHRPDTYARWAAAVPSGFRFAVKAPRAITHERRLVDPDAALDRFLGEIQPLGEKMGPLLVQLPPSLAFDPAVAQKFFTALGERHSGPVVCEPRHATWFEPEADALLCGFAVARVAADPARVPRAAEPGGFPDLAYYRLHGFPVIYRSAYDGTFLDGLAAKLARHANRGVPAWCIFDNTMLGAATANALALLDRLAPKRRRSSGQRVG